MGGKTIQAVLWQHAKSWQMDSAVSCKLSGSFRPLAAWFSKRLITFV